MIEELAYGGAALEGPFAVYAEPPWLLHLSGELDLCDAPALTKCSNVRSSAAAPSGLIAPI
jgi:hypothetical protein